MLRRSTHDYRATLRAGTEPMLVLVGADDEAFRAEAYPAAIALHPGAATVIVPGESHDGVTRSNETFAAVRRFVAPLGR